MYHDLTAAAVPPPDLFSSKPLTPGLQMEPTSADWGLEGGASAENGDEEAKVELEEWAETMSVPSVMPDDGPPPTAAKAFKGHVQLKDLLPRTRRGIMMDVPRTFYEFERKSVVISQYLEKYENKLNMLSALCRLLVVACKLLRMSYCQGMNYIAASVLLNCVCETQPVETGEELEIKACQLFCHLLTCHNVGEWFRDSTVLSNQLKKLDFILYNHAPSSLAIRYLASNSYNSHFWAMEWFTTFCSVGAPRELAQLVQNMILSGKEVDVIIRVGVAMFSLAQAKILQQKGMLLEIF